MEDGNDDRNQDAEPRLELNRCVHAARKRLRAIEFVKSWMRAARRAAAVSA